MNLNPDYQLVLATSAHGNALSKKETAERLVSRLADLLQREAEAELLEREMASAVDDTRSEAVVMESRAASGPTAESAYAKEALQAHTAARMERKASNMMHLTWDQALAGILKICRFIFKEK